MATIHPMLQPYRPSADVPFDAVKAAHLLNRAGFGGTEREIAQVIQEGPSAAVDRLLNFPDAGVDEKDGPDLSPIKDYPRSFEQLKKFLKDKKPEQIKQFRQKYTIDNRQVLVATGLWWLKRMVGGPCPLQEKLTLFWHGHFATSARDERSAWLMWQQNQLLRKNSAGNFRQFVNDISRDPAMIDYLNNNQNRKKRPNENYARELMELFTLGIGHYTEKDVAESARAFTGWTHDGDRFLFRKHEHDDGEKTFLGRNGNFDGGDIIDIILQQPQCAIFIAGKLYEYFVHEAPDDAVVQSLADVLRDAKYDLRPMLKAMLTSKAFYSARSIGSQIKCPIQLVVGSTRLLGVDLPPQFRLTQALQRMGQVPLMPPNVKGWPVGKVWINTSTLLTRCNLVMSMVDPNPLPPGKKKAATAPAQGFNPEGGPDPAAVVDRWVNRLIQRPIDPDKQRVLLSALGDNSSDPAAVKRMIQLIVSMPEYQLC